MASPGGELTTQKDTQKKEQSWLNKPHEGLVDALRVFIQERGRHFYGRYAEQFSPQEIIHTWLKIEGESFEPGKREFFRPLWLAWDAIAYNHFQPGSNTELSVAHDLWVESTRATKNVRQNIVLSDPLQIKVIDALAEVAGIQHKNGQTEIGIPEKLRGSNYTAPILDRIATERSKTEKNK